VVSLIYPVTCVQTSGVKKPDHQLS
jgi:hypothetical protein